MSVYLITLHEADEGVWARLKEHWPNRHYTLTDRMALVAPEGIAVTQDIADALGLDDEHEVSGIVVELLNYAGRGPSSAVEWIEKVE